MATYNRYQGNTGKYIRLPDAYPQDSEYPQRLRTGGMGERRPPEFDGSQTEEKNHPQDAHNAAHEPTGGSNGRTSSADMRGPFTQNARHDNNAALKGQYKKRPPHNPPPSDRSKSSLEGLLAGLSGGFTSRLGNLDTEDLLLLAVVYLMYRESGDKQLLVVLAALLLF